MSTTGRQGMFYEQSDFLTEDETIREYRARVLPRRADRVAVALIPAGIVATILLAFIAAAVIATVAP